MFSFRLPLSPPSASPSSLHQPLCLFSLFSSSLPSPSPLTVFSLVLTSRLFLLLLFSHLLQLVLFLSVSSSDYIHTEPADFNRTSLNIYIICINTKTTCSLTAVLKIFRFSLVFGVCGPCTHTICVLATLVLGSILSRRHLLHPVLCCSSGVLSNKESSVAGCPSSPVVFRGQLVAFC